VLDDARHVLQGRRRAKERVSDAVETIRPRLLILLDDDRRRHPQLLRLLLRRLLLPLVLLPSSWLLPLPWRRRRRRLLLLLLLPLLLLRRRLELLWDIRLDVCAAIKAARTKVVVAARRTAVGRSTVRLHFLLANVTEALLPLRRGGKLGSERVWV
jgi:hypothetical protein